MKTINFDKVGGRTFVLVLGCAAVNSVMRWFDHIDNSTYATIISGTVIAFVAKSSVDEHTQSRERVQSKIADKQAEASPPNKVEQVAT